MLQRCTQTQGPLIHAVLEDVESLTRKYNVEEQVHDSRTVIEKRKNNPVSNLKQGRNHRKLAIIYNEFENMARHVNTEIEKMSLYEVSVNSCYKISLIDC